MFSLSGGDIVEFIGDNWLKCKIEKPQQMTPSEMTGIQLARVLIELSAANKCLDEVFQLWHGWSRGKLIYSLFRHHSHWSYNLKSVDHLKFLSQKVDKNIQAVGSIFCSGPGILILLQEHLCKILIFVVFGVTSKVHVYSYMTSLRNCPWLIIACLYLLPSL